MTGSNRPYWVHSAPELEAIAHDAAADNPPCPGVCNRGYRADPGNVEYRPGQPVWCRPCADRILAAIGRLPELAAALFDYGAEDGKIAAGGQSDATRKATRAGSPSGSPAWDAIDEIVTWAGRTEDELRARLRHGGNPAGDWWTGSTTHRAAVLVGSVAYLIEYGVALLSSNIAVPAGRDALQLERRAEQATGQARLTHRLPVACPDCDRRALVREDGSEQVDCRACGRSWPEADYRRLVLVLSAAAKGKGA